MIGNVGEARHGQDMVKLERETKLLQLRRFAGRTVAAAWSRTGRGCAARRRNAHDGVAVERPARERRHGNAQKPAPGPSVGARRSQRRELMRALTRGALAENFPTDLWTLPRVGQLIERRFGRSYSESQV